LGIFKFQDEEKQLELYAGYFYVLAAILGLTVAIVDERYMWALTELKTRNEIPQKKAARRCNPLQPTPKD